MGIALDPQGRETAALLSMAGLLEGKSVLEIGCGDGRLTWRYAAAASQVIGIDPHEDRIARAIQDTPADLREKMKFEATDLFAYTQENPDRRFDLAILSWSL
jgi:cyclopropane fatty-acyl-phospholipid synthase-like methyltransferase